MSSAPTTPPRRRTATARPTPTREPPATAAQQQRPLLAVGCWLRPAAPSHPNCCRPPPYRTLRRPRCLQTPGMPPSARLPPKRLPIPPRTRRSTIKFAVTDKAGKTAAGVCPGATYTVTVSSMPATGSYRSAAITEQPPGPGLSPGRVQAGRQPRHPRSPCPPLWPLCRRSPLAATSPALRC
jgi:hypothetical protein